jgi:glucokinase
MILASDIGGTKTLIALFEPQPGDRLRLVREQTFVSKDHQSLEEIVTAFLQGEKTAQVEAACFGAAGPVLERRCQTTNLPWLIEEINLVKASGVARVRLLNDLEATAYGMLFLEPHELHPLNPHARGRRQGNVAVIAAGTGLGEAMLCWDSEQYYPVASEGGHGDLAPHGPQEVELMRYLHRQYEHVSRERVLSGPGIHNLFCFLRDTTGRQPTAEVAEKMAKGDPSAAITQAALAGSDPLCLEAMDVFCRMYGAEAGNLALTCVAIGGVYVGGGIAPKILPLLERGPFLHGFLQKGRLSELLETVPVHVCLNERTALLGAAHFAARRVAKQQPHSGHEQ